MHQITSVAIACRRDTCDQHTEQSKKLSRSLNVELQKALQHAVNGSVGVLTQRFEDPAQQERAAHKGSGTAHPASLWFLDDESWAQQQFELVKPTDRRKKRAPATCERRLVTSRHGKMGSDTTRLRTVTNRRDACDGTRISAVHTRLTQSVGLECASLTSSFNWLERLHV